MKRKEKSISLFTRTEGIIYLQNIKLVSTYKVTEILNISDRVALKNIFVNISIRYLFQKYCYPPVLLEYTMSIRYWNYSNIQKYIKDA